MPDRIYPSNFYGDTLRFFIGVVEGNSDPLRLGRVRVRVHGLHTSAQSEISTGDLPWAQTLVPTTEGGTSGIGRSSQLQPGAMVFGIFLDGKASQLPLVMGSIPRIEIPSSIQIASDGSDQRYAPSIFPNSAPPGVGSTGARNRVHPMNTSEFISSVGNTNPERAFNFFVAYGFTPFQAAGVVGNLMQESGPTLNTSAEAAGTEQSYGIAQWNRATPRYDELVEFSSDLGLPWTDLDAQLQFIIFELEKYSYLGLSQLRASTTIEEAVVAFETKYERPGTPHRASRISYATDIYNRMVS
jgi:hypothetical protein